MLSRVISTIGKHKVYWSGYCVVFLVDFLGNMGLVNDTVDLAIHFVFANLSAVFSWLFVVAKLLMLVI